MTEKKKRGRKPGYKMAEETKAKISETKRKYFADSEASAVTRAKMSESAKGLSYTNFMAAGGSHSAETRRKMSMAHLGKKRTEEHRKNISKAKAGQPALHRQNRTWMTFDGHRVWFFFEDMAEIYEQYKNTNAEGSKRNMARWSQLEYQNTNK